MEENPDVKVIYSNEKYMESRAGVEQKDHESERESSIQESKLENQQELDEGETEEANKDLDNQNAVDQSREQNLQAPPPEDAQAGERRDDVSAGLSQLQLSDNKGQKPTSPSEHAGPDEETPAGKILVEKDRKFELLSLCDIESQGILLPISVSFTDFETQQTPAESSSLPAASQMKETPPSDTKEHSESKDVEKQKTESSKYLKSSTYSLTPRQKELRRQIEIRKEILRREVNI